MKIIDIQATDISEIDSNDLDNFFNVYISQNNDYVFNLNSTLYFSNISNIPLKYFKYYECKNGDTFMGISYKLYKTTHLWWLLMKLNNVRDAFATIRIGNYLRYLDQSIVNNIISSL